MEELNTLIDSFMIFLTSKNYLIVEIGQNNYLVNPNQEYKIFKIGINQFADNKVIEEKMLKDFKLKSSEIVSILLIDDEKYRNSESDILYAANKQEFEIIIRSYFLDFINLDSYHLKSGEHDCQLHQIENQEEDDDDNSKEKLLKELFSEDSPQYKELKNVAIKTQNPPIVAKIISIFFTFLPCVIFSISFIIDTLLHFDNYFNSSIVRVGYWGAVDYRLTVVAGQYWRVLTYGFVPDFSTFLFGILELFLCCSILYNLIKFSSSVVGYISFFSSIIIGYVLTGFVSAIVMQNGLLSGPIFLLAIVAGSLTSTLWNKKDKSLINIFSKNKLVPAFILIVCLPLINLQLEKFVMAVFAFWISGITSVLFTAIFKQFDYLSFFASLAVVLLTILFIVLVIVLRNKSYSTAQDINIAKILALQAKSKLISLDKANEILASKLMYNFVITIDFKVI